MGLISRLYTFVNGPGNKIDADQVNAEFNQIIAALGSLDDANFDGSPPLEGSKVNGKTLAKPKARAYHSGAQAIPSGAQTLLQLDSERFDTDAIHDSSINNARLTCKTSGLYLITGSVQWAASGGTHIRQVSIRLNGATFIASQKFGGGDNSEAFEQSVSTLYQLAVNDYVELVVRHTLGANLNINAAGNLSPEFAMVLEST